MADDACTDAVWADGHLVDNKFTFSVRCCAEVHADYNDVRPNQSLVGFFIQNAPGNLSDRHLSEYARDQNPRAHQDGKQNVLFFHISIGLSPFS